MKDIEHLGYLFNDWDGTGPRLPYHYLVKSILDYPPDGYCFSENPKENNTPKKLIIDFCEDWFERFKEYGYTRNDFNGVAIRHRPIDKMAQIPLNKNCWITTIPNYAHPNNWLMEIEDYGPLLWPHVGNNHFMRHALSHPIRYAIKSLFELNNFKAMITHIKDTKEQIRILFGDDVYNKTHFCQLGYKDKFEDRKKRSNGDLRLLFHGSYNHTHTHFKYRGGYEAIEAFLLANNQNSGIKLNVVYDKNGGGITSETQAILYAHPDITYYDRYVSNNEMHEILLNSDALLIPAYRVHSYTVVQALCYGLPVICTDGWGFDEYVKHKYNGWVAKGNKSSFKEHGILVEEYVDGVQNAVLDNLVDGYHYLFDLDNYERLSNNARQTYLDNYTIEKRNTKLKQIFDAVL